MSEVRVGLGRSNVVVIIFLLLTVGVFAGVLFVVGLQSKDSSASILALVFAAILAIPLVLLLKGLPRLLARRWSFPLPPVTGIGERIAVGVRIVAPSRWMGWIVRS